MSLRVASTRLKDERSCGCSCDGPWPDWLWSWGAMLSVASESKAREMRNFIFLLQVIRFGTTFGESSVNCRNYPTESAPSQAAALKKHVLLGHRQSDRRPICLPSGVTRRSGGTDHLPVRIGSWDCRSGGKGLSGGVVGHTEVIQTGSGKIALCSRQGAINRLRRRPI